MAFGNLELASISKVCKVDRCAHERTERESQLNSRSSVLVAVLAIPFLSAYAVAQTHQTGVVFARGVEYQIFVDEDYHQNVVGAEWLSGATAFNDFYQPFDESLTATRNWTSGFVTGHFTESLEAKLDFNETQATYEASSSAKLTDFELIFGPLFTVSGNELATTSIAEGDLGSEPGFDSSVSSNGLELTVLGQLVDLPDVLAPGTVLFEDEGFQIVYGYDASTPGRIDRIGLFAQFQDYQYEGKAINGYVTLSGSMSGVHSAVPEPGTMAAIGLGIAGLLARRRRISRR